MGWRYVMYTSGALVFLMSIARITVIRLKETPKYLLAEGRDEDVVAGFQAMAQKYNRPCSITLEMLEACGPIQGAHGKTRFSLSEVTVHFRGLFATKTIGLSTSLIWFSWTLMVSPPLGHGANVLITQAGSGISSVLRLLGQLPCNTRCKL